MYTSAVVRFFCCFVFINLSFVTVYVQVCVCVNTLAKH